MRKPTNDFRSPGVMDWLLRPFADVHAGEAGPALLMALNVFLLLGCYYILKPVREALILTSSGAEIKSYASSGQVLLLLFLVPAYSAFASRVNRTALLTSVTLFFAANLVAFYFLARAAMPHLDVVFFIWVGIFNVMIVAQFWSLANDIYTSEEGKRLFPIVAFGSTLGAIMGATVAEGLIDPKKATPNAIDRLLLIGAVILVACGALTWLISRREKVARTGARDREQSMDRPLPAKGAFRLVFSNRYLLLIALMILVYNFARTNGDFVMGKMLENTAKNMAAVGQTTGLNADEFQKQFIGNYYAGFYKWVNWATAIIQLFLVSRIFKWFGVRVALFVLPMIALGGYALIAITPVLGLLRVVKTAEYSTDYSIQNTSRQALFLPVSREAKYKAKQAIDTFFWRVGDVLTAGLVFLGTKLALTPRTFAAINVGLVAVWLAIVIAIAREHRKLTAEAEETAAASAHA